MKTCSPEAEEASRATSSSDARQSRESNAFAGFEVTDPVALGFHRGGWEIFQHRRFVEIYARHYHAEIVSHHGLLLIARKLPILGILHAQLLSPEAANERPWHHLLADLPAGRVEILTNRRAVETDILPTAIPDFYSMVVDLRACNEAALFARLERRTQKAIRRASKAGMQTHLAEGAREVREFHALLERVTGRGRRYGVPPLTLLIALQSAELGRLYVARYGGRTVGGIFIVARQYSHGLAAGFDAAACGGLPGNLLYWDTMRKEMTRGMPLFDLGMQSLSGNAGLTFAKRAYAPKLVPAFRYQLGLSAWRDRLDASLRIVRGLARRSSPHT